MLPEQQTNVAKYYHEDHFALTCAAASGNLRVLKDELRSPSIFFKQLAATQVVRLQSRYHITHPPTPHTTQTTHLTPTLSDEDLYNEILASVPFVRSKLLHAAITERRTALIERILPVISSEYGFDYAASILHGCSYVSFAYLTYKLTDLRTSLIAEYLNDENFEKNKNIHWDIIARHVRM
jgi:hypothetical protein